MTASEIYAAILAEVRKIVPNARMEDSGGTGRHFIINGEEIRVDARERTEGNWHFTPTGKWQVNVAQDNYRTKMFPPRKSGFDYAVIAGCIIKEATLKRDDRIIKEGIHRDAAAFESSDDAKIIRWLMGVTDAWRHRTIADRLKQLNGATREYMLSIARDAEPTE